MTTLAIKLRKSFSCVQEIPSTRDLNKTTMAGSRGCQSLESGHVTLVGDAAVDADDVAVLNHSLPGRYAVNDFLVQGNAGDGRKRSGPPRHAGLSPESRFTFRSADLRFGPFVEVRRRDARDYPFVQSLQYIGQYPPGRAHQRNLVFGLDHYHRVLPPRSPVLH